MYLSTSDTFRGLVSTRKLKEAREEPPALSHDCSRYPPRGRGRRFTSKMLRRQPAYQSLTKKKVITSFPSLFLQKSNKPTNMTYSKAHSGSGLPMLNTTEVKSPCHPEHNFPVVEKVPEHLRRLQKRRLAVTGQQSIAVIRVSTSDSFNEHSVESLRNMFNPNEINFVTQYEQCSINQLHFHKVSDERAVIDVTVTKPDFQLWYWSWRSCRCGLGSSTSQSWLGQCFAHCR